MIIFTVEAGGRAVAAFNAEDMEAATAFVEDTSFQCNLLEFATDEGSLWNGIDALEIRLALDEETAAYHESFAVAYTENPDHIGAWVCLLAFSRVAGD